jgi:hypothetical protein
MAALNGGHREVSGMVMAGAGDAPTAAASARPTPVRPGAFCAFLLQALEAAEGQTRRRKRDQSPDKIGLAIKRELLQRAAAADPEPAAFEGWLMEQILRTPSAGPVRAMCEQIYLEYQMAALQPDFAAWLAAGAPSDDADPAGTERPRKRADAPGRHDRWHGTDDPAFACTCQLDHR